MRMALLLLLLSACSSASAQPSAPDPSSRAAFSASPAASAPLEAQPSLPPGYGCYVPSEEVCKGCVYLRVRYDREPFDTVNLCAHPFKGPRKPLDACGTHLRSNVDACDPRCCY